ncbi:hypothetical protein K8I28_15690, partial [bacterium]|nr:hypothetical protein [bacterium]
VHESPDSDIQDRRSEDEEVIEETPPPQKVLAPSQAGASGESNRPPMMNTKPGEGSYSSARDARVRNKLESEKNDSSKKPARLRNLADPNAATVQTKKDSSPETKILMTSENSPKIKKDANPSQLTSEEVTDEALIESFMKTIPPSKPPSIKNDEKNKHHHRNRMLLNVDSSEKKSDVAERKPDVVLGVDSTGNSEEEEIDLAKLNPQQRRKYQDELAMKSVLGRGALGKNRTPSSKPTQKK